MSRLILALFKRINEIVRVELRRNAGKSLFPESELDIVGVRGCGGNKALNLPTAVLWARPGGHENNIQPNQYFAYPGEGSKVEKQTAIQIHRHTGSLREGITPKWVLNTDTTKVGCSHHVMNPITMEIEIKQCTNDNVTMATIKPCSLTALQQGQNVPTEMHVKASWENSLETPLLDLAAAPAGEANKCSCNTGLFSLVDEDRDSEAGVPSKPVDTSCCCCLQ